MISTSVGELCNIIMGGGCTWEVWGNFHQWLFMLDYTEHLPTLNQKKTSWWRRGCTRFLYALYMYIVFSLLWPNTWQEQVKRGRASLASSLRRNAVYHRGQVWQQKRGASAHGASEPGSRRLMGNGTRGWSSGLSPRQTSSGETLPPPVSTTFHTRVSGFWKRDWNSWTHSPRRSHSLLAAFSGWCWNIIMQAIHMRYPWGTGQGWGCDAG